MTPPVAPVLAVVVLKPWYMSKINQAGVVTFIIFTLGLLKTIPMTATQVEILGIVAAALTFILRTWLTGSPVTDMGAKIGSPPNGGA